MHFPLFSSISCKMFMARSERLRRVWRELKDEVPAHVRPWLEAATKPL